MKKTTPCSKCSGAMIEIFVKDNKIHGKYCSECNGKGYIFVKKIRGEWKKI